MVSSDNEVVPTLLSTSSASGQSKEDMPVVTLGSPLYTLAGLPSDVAAAVKSAEVRRTPSKMLILLQWAISRP
jgi:hypothetical protein